VTWRDARGPVSQTAILQILRFGGIGLNSAVAFGLQLGFLAACSAAASAFCRLCSGAGFSSLVASTAAKKQPLALWRSGRVF
jgi:hypothetical protein